MGILNKKNRDFKIFLRFCQGAEEPQLIKEFDLTGKHIRKIVRSFANDLKSKDSVLFHEMVGELEIPNCDLLSEAQILKRSQKMGPKIAIYFLIYQNKIVYVGQSKNLYSRIGAHHEGGRIQFDRFSFIPCEETKLDILETFYIQKFNPIHNKQQNFRSNIIGILNEVRNKSQNN